MLLVVFVRDLVENKRWGFVPNCLLMVVLLLVGNCRFWVEDPRLRLPTLCVLVCLVSQSKGTEAYGMVDALVGHYLRPVLRIDGLR